MAGPREAADSEESVTRREKSPGEPDSMTVLVISWALLFESVVSPIPEVEPLAIT